MFWGRGRPYTAAELSAHLHLAPENNFGEKDNRKEKYWWEGQPERKNIGEKDNRKENNLGEMDNRKENNIGEKKQR